VPIGTSLVLIAAGAILHYAVTAHASGIDIQTVGTILMIVGILGLILSLLYTFLLNDKQKPSSTDYDAPTQRYGPRDRY
jgi:Co/Zn/Cd efflux system component